MANNSPTLVMASLSDDQLKKSIDSLVSHVDEAMKKMVQSTNNAVGEMEAKLKSLDNLKIDSVGSANGGASKRTKAQNAETDAIEKSIAARDKQIKKNQEVSMSYDQMAAATQKATSGGKMSVIETYDMQIEMFKNRLREVRQDIDIFNAAIGSGKKTQIEWGQQGLKQANAEAEKLMRIITTLENQRGNLSNILAPQGHTIQNYVNSLQKANPELAQLNEQFKRGQSLLQQGKTTVNSVSNAFENGTNTSKKSLDELNAYVAQSINRERERRDAIRQTGLAARETADQLIRSAHQQASIESNAPITGVRELRDAIEQMRRAYFDMSSAEKVSPIGIALNEDIKRANDAMTVIRRYNQSIFNSQQNDANKITNASTLNSLRESLKNLTEQYNRLTVAELNAGKGDALIQHFQDTTRAAQILQRTLNRPVNLKAALSGDERTLDDIAYKMQRLRSYRQGIDLTKPNAANEIKQVDEALARLQKDADKWMNKSQEMIKNNTALGRSWNYMKNRLAFYFTVGASTQFIKNLVEVRSQYEMNEKALGILIDSAERGTQIFNELSQMALVSPYTLIELSTAAKQLTAYDVAAKDVVDTTRRLADMAAAVGIPIERLTYALGQIKAYGYLNSRDARMFANAGIPLVKQLSEYYTELEGRLVSTADVYDRIKKKAIDYNEVMEVINKMTDQGGKFFDFQAKMADTLKVQLANLTLAWNNMLNEIGKSNQGIVSFSIGALKELFLQWKKIDSAIYSAAWAGGLVVAIRALNVLLVKAGFNFRILSKDMTAAGIAGQGLATKMKTLGSSIASVAKSSRTWWTLLAFAAVDAAKDLYYMKEAQENLNKSIRDGAKDNYNNISKFLEQYKEVRDSLYSTQKVAIGSFYNPTTRKAEATAYAEQQVAQDIDNNEAKKAWEAIREQIELTSQSSDVFISKLLSIENMSERVRQGFNILDDIQVVNAALKEIDDETIKMSTSLSAWWNLWSLPEGLIDNLEDYKNAVNDTENSWKKAGKTIVSFLNPLALYTGGTNIIENYVKDSEDRLSDFREDLKVTTDSIIDFIELKGWSGDEGKINQVFEQITQKLILDNQLDPQKAYTLQVEIEEARSRAAKNALAQRIQGEREAYKISHDESIRQAANADIERYKKWDETNGRSKVEWERFTKWLKEQHISETTAMFRNMDAEDIKSLNFQEGKHAEWVNRMVTQYAKEHKMSYDEAFGYLKHWVSSANQWSIFLPLIISTEDKKSVYDQLGEYDKAIDDADSQIARLTRRIGELNAKRKRSKEETEELTRAEEELSDAQKAKAEAEAKGGHGKQEKKDEKAARKAARQAESELQKALKDELSTIEKVRSIYKDLTKSGMSHADAVERATKGWEETVNAINKVLQKNGLQKLDLSKFAGVENPRELVNMLQSQLNTLIKRGAKPAEIKELQTKIQTLNVDADKYDLTKITKGLNNELGKLKDEYELAVELDANPELGGMFADFMGINMDELPKTFQEATKKAQEYIDKVFRDNGRTDKIDIASMLDKESFDKWVEDSGLKMDSELVKSVEAFRQYLHKTQVDETKKQIDEWSKLLEKYAEYEYKRKQILDTYEREMDVARKQNADKAIRDAIERRKNEQLAELDFNEFMKTPEWIVATGDLAGMSKQAIDMLIEEIERYKKTARNLSPKQIHNLNKALKNLYKEQRKNNPFRAISNMLEEARGRAETFDEEIEKVQKDIQDLTFQKSAELAAGIVNEDTDKRLKGAIERLKELKEHKEELGKPDASDWVQAINDTVAAVKAAVSVFDDLAKAIGGVKGNSDIDKIFSVLEKGGQGAAIGAQIGQGYGAIIGAVAGVATGIISTFADQWSGNASITEAIQDSEHEVRKLELAYIDLEHAVNEAYGEAEIGAKQAVIANKKLQLAELQRQLALEKSRSSKNRDEERIIEIQKQIKELEYEISDATKDIVNDLLGISSVGDFAENLVSQMIEAFKNGEDYMEKFEESFDDMVDNMIMKAIVSRVIGDRIKQIFDYLDSKIKSDSQGLYDEKAELEQERDALKESFESLEKNPVTKEMFGEIIRMYKDKLRDLDNRIEEINRQISEAGSQSITPELTEDVRDMVSGMKDNVREEFLAMMDAFGITYGQSSSGKDLSQLQQGISQITEVTAQSLEAYANSISQQAYLRNDLLTQIRDAVIGMNMDIQVATQAQMLLQLQQSFQVQQSIQSILEGVLVPSGRAFAVELMS